MRAMLTTRWNTKFSYAVMIEPQILIGNVKARLNDSSISITRTLATSSPVIERENRPSTFRYSTIPSAKATTLITP